MKRASIYIIAIVLVLISSCGDGQTIEPARVSEQVFVENAQLSFETVSFDVRDFQQVKIEDGTNTVFIFNENNLVDLVGRGILTVKSESPIPDNVIVIEIPSNVNEYSLNLTDLEEYEREDIGLYRDVFDGVYIENLTFQATKLNENEWSVNFSADLSDNGTPFFTISDSGTYRRAALD